MLCKEAIEEFIAIYHKNFGIQLAFEEAEEKANKFFNFMKLIIRPIDESTNLAEQVTGQDLKAERNKTNHGNKTQSQKG